MALRGVRGENLRPESAEFRGLTLGFVSAWRKLAVRAQLRTSLVDREICWTVIAGSVACCTVTRRKSTRGTSSRGGAMTTMEQVVSQMQQELLTIRAQIAPRVQMSEAVHAADILTAAQAHEDAPNLIDVNSQGRPKVFSGKEEDFQPWAKKMEAFFAGVIKELEMMLWWAADKTMKITTVAIDLEFLPTNSNEGRGVHHLEFILQHMHTTLVALTSQEANDTVANSRKNSLEACRRLQKRYGPTAGGRKRSILRAIICPDVVLSRNSERELNAKSPMWGDTRS